MILRALRIGTQARNNKPNSFWYSLQHPGLPRVAWVICLPLRLWLRWIGSASLGQSQRLHSQSNQARRLQPFSLQMSLLAREVVPSNVVNDQDQGALATIAAALALTTIGIFLCIRLLIRWPWQSLFGSDDAAVAITSVRIHVVSLYIESSDIF